LQYDRINAKTIGVDVSLGAVLDDQWHNAEVSLQTGAAGVNSFKALLDGQGGSPVPVAEPHATTQTKLVSTTVGLNYVSTFSGSITYVLDNILTNDTPN